jgi:hypothetical protein
MTPTAQQLETLVDRCEPFRGSTAFDGYPNSLALCIVDSIQSTGVKYPSVANVVTRYRAYRREQGADPYTDTAQDLATTFVDLGGPEAWSARIGNGNRTSTQKGAPLKSVAIEAEAAAMIQAGINTADDLRRAAADPEQFSDVAKAWRGVIAQSSGITWHYVQMLAGIPGIKPDRMIVRFVVNALNLPRAKVTPAFCVEILTAAAQALEMTATELDHAIWNWQRGQ